MSDIGKIDVNGPGVNPQNGLHFRQDDDKLFVRVYWDGSTPATLVKGTPYVVTPVISSATNKVLAFSPRAAATSAFNVMIGIATETLTAAGYTEMQIEGPCDYVLCTASASIDAGGESLELINAGTGLVYDADTPSAKTVAIAMQTLTTGTYLKAYLLHGKAGCVITAT